MLELDGDLMGRTPDESGLVETAQRFALRAHAEQVDKAGEPYVEHPARVAATAARAGSEAEAVGWLHDVVEDSPATLNELRAAGLPEPVLAAVDALTRRDGEPAEVYYRRVAGNALARVVKDADLADNAAPDRLARLDEATRVRLCTKYAHAREMLAAFGGV
jgi:(p)ppGpp synthase/HD superfamily hydrolase